MSSLFIQGCSITGLMPTPRKEFTRNEKKKNALEDQTWGSSTDQRVVVGSSTARPSCPTVPSVAEMIRGPSSPVARGCGQPCNDYQDMINRRNNSGMGSTATTSTINDDEQWVMDYVYPRPRRSLCKVFRDIGAKILGIFKTC